MAPTTQGDLGSSEASREAQRRRIEAFVISAMDRDAVEDRDDASRLPSPRSLKKAVDDSALLSSKKKDDESEEYAVTSGDAGRAKRMRRRSSSLQPPRARRTSLENTRRELEAAREALTTQRRSKKKGGAGEGGAGSRAPVPATPHGATTTTTTGGRSAVVPSSSTTTTTLSTSPGGQGNVVQQQFTVVVAGPSKSGKTKLTETFALGAARPRATPTMGVERHDVDELCVWDTSGDARFDAATLGLARVANALVVVYARDDEDGFLAAKHRATFAAGQLRGDTIVVIVCTTSTSTSSSKKTMNGVVYAAPTGIVEDEKDDFAASSSSSSSSKLTVPVVPPGEACGKKLAALLGAPFFSLDPTDKPAVDRLFDALKADLMKARNKKRKQQLMSGTPAFGTVMSSDDDYDDDPRRRVDLARDDGFFDNAAKRGARPHQDRFSDHDLDSMQSDLVLYAAAFAGLLVVSLAAGAVLASDVVTAPAF